MAKASEFDANLPAETRIAAPGGVVRSARLRNKVQHAANASAQPASSAAAPVSVLPKPKRVTKPKARKITEWIPEDDSDDDYEEKKKPPPKRGKTAAPAGPGRPAAAAKLVEDDSSSDDVGPELSKLVPPKKGKKVVLAGSSKPAAAEKVAGREPVSKAPNGLASRSTITAKLPPRNTGLVKDNGADIQDKRADRGLLSEIIPTVREQVGPVKPVFLGRNTAKGVEDDPDDSYQDDGEEEDDIEEFKAYAVRDSILKERKPLASITPRHRSPAPEPEMDLSSLESNHESFYIPASNKNTPRKQPRYQDWSPSGDPYGIPFPSAQRQPIWTPTPESKRVRSALPNESFNSFATDASYLANKRAFWWAHVTWIALCFIIALLLWTVGLSLYWGNTFATIGPPAPCDMTVSTRPFPQSYKDSFKVFRRPDISWDPAVRQQLEDFGQYIGADPWLMDNCILPRNIMKLPLVTCQGRLPWYNLTETQVLWLNENSGWGYNLDWDLTEKFNEVFDMQFALQELQTSWMLSDRGPASPEYGNKRCQACEKIKTEKKEVSLAGGKWWSRNSGNLDDGQRTLFKRIRASRAFDRLERVLGVKSNPKVELMGVTDVDTPYYQGPSDE